MASVRRLLMTQQMRRMTSSAASGGTPLPLLSQLQGHTCVITLNRPKALNSLNTEMCDAMTSVINEAKHAAMIVKGSGGKAFCAGGDVKQIWIDGQELKEDPRIGTGAPGLTTADFFRQEYIMNHAIGTTPIPQVSLWDGIVMGGGVGISVHGKFRVATEKTLFAMPETGIGLFPDVGSSHWLHKLGPIGVFIGLTGVRLKAADLMSTGIATHFITSDKLERLESRLVDACTANPATNVDIINDILAAESGAPDASVATIGPNVESIQRTFDKATVEEIVEALRAEDTEWGRKTLETVLRMSPTSLKVSLKQIHEGARKNSLSECLQMEYRITQGCMRPGADFYEGIRAVLVDRDNSPKWNPSQLSDVTSEQVDSFFAPIKHELVL